MADLWTLTYPGVDYTWGDLASGVMDAKGSPPDLGDHSWRDDDGDMPRGDGRMFGQDFLDGRTITFDLLVLGSTETEVRDRIAELARVWRADAVRTTPGAVATLRANIGGRTRLVYGRPRRFSPVDKTTRHGLGRVVCDFACTGMEWYDPTEEQLLLPFVAPPSGGLVAPLVTPLTTVPAATATRAITVGGKLPAWPVVTVYGPITNPRVELTGLWTLALDLAIPDGQSITVDTRPWQRTVLRADGASFAGSLTRTSVRMARASIPAGTYEVALRGIDATGTSQLRIAWRNTYAHL